MGRIIPFVAGAGDGVGVVGGFAFGDIGAGKEPVGHGQMVDNQGQEVVGEGPVGVFSIDFLGERAVARQGPDQGQDPPRRQLLSVVIKEIYAVVPE